MSLLNSNFKIIILLPRLFMLALAILLSACGSGSSSSGGGSTPIAPLVPGNGIPLVPLIPPQACITPVGGTPMPPMQANITSDQVWHNYTNPSTAYPIYGYNNPAHLKRIRIVNNYSHTIYPVVYSPTNFIGTDKVLKKLSRIFVGKPSCANKTQFFVGLPPTGVADVYVPKQMWNAGHVKIFTEPPPMLQQDVGVKINSPIYTIDTNKASPNYGYMLYTSGTGGDFKPDLPFQLSEYTFESPCAQDIPSCATVASDKLTVDFDVSAVDHLFLPLAMQESTGSRGYVGTSMTVDALQAQLHLFLQGSGDFSYDQNVGWAFYYGSNGSSGYKNGLVKIPAGYNTVNSIIISPPAASSYNNAVNSVWIYDKTTGLPSDAQSVLFNATNNIAQRWSKFWQTTPLDCSLQVDPVFCTNFIKTLNFLHNNILNACQFKNGPALCSDPNGDLSVASDIQKIRALIGYTELAITFSDPGGIYPASDPDNICTVQNGPLPSKDGKFYSNCFRDALKSALRGVPYPFWVYPNQYYPVISSPYTLNPFVWFIHKSLNLSEYAFSVDDDIGNQELVGNGIIVTVGGLNGLTAQNAFDPRQLQIISFPGGINNPTWQGTISSSSTCIAGKVGGCDLNIHPDAYTSVDVSLTGIADPGNFLKFTITSDGKQTCHISGLPDYEYDHLVVTNCQTSSNLQNCGALIPIVNFSDPTNCAQTVSVSPVTPIS